MTDLNSHNRMSAISSLCWSIELDCFSIKREHNFFGSFSKSLVLDNASALCEIGGYSNILWYNASKTGLNGAMQPTNLINWAAMLYTVFACWLLKLGALAKEPDPLPESSTLCPSSLKILYLSILKKLSGNSLKE